MKRTVRGHSMISRPHRARSRRLCHRCVAAIEPPYVFGVATGGGHQNTEIKSEHVTDSRDCWDSKSGKKMKKLLIGVVFP